MQQDMLLGNDQESNKSKAGVLPYIALIAGGVILYVASNLAS
jgi:hypothetical protein